MSEPRWPDGSARQPRGGGAGGYRGPEAGAYERDSGGYRDDFALPGDDHGWYRDERGERGDDREMYRDESAGRADGRGSGRGTTYEDDRGRRAEPSRRPAPADRGSRRWGTLPGRTGVSIVVGSAALGALITAVTGSQPGFLLGFLLVVGTITAVLAVRPQAAYRIIPVPALTYVAAAALAGLVSDRATGTSGTALAINGVQWIASGFIAMTVATVLAIVISLARLTASRRAQGGAGRGPRDSGRGRRDPGRGQRDSARGQRDPGRGQRDPRRGQGSPGRKPGAGAGRERPQPARSRSEQRRIDRDPDYPVAAKDPRGGGRRYPG